MIPEVEKDDLDGLLRLYMQLHDNPMPEKSVDYYRFDEEIMLEAGLNRFIMSVKQWVSRNYHAKPHSPTFNIKHKTNN